MAQLEALSRACLQLCSLAALERLPEVGNWRVFHPPCRLSRLQIGLILLGEVSHS
jgi:hypothetical protein